MKNKIIFSLLAALALTMPSVAEKCAYLHAREDGKYADRIEEGKNLAARMPGWKFDFFDNRELEALTANLPGYDMVIFGTLCNVEGGDPFAPYRKQWRDYLANGGVILVLTACEQDSYKSMLNAVDETPGAKSSICVMMGRYDISPRIDYSDDAILYRPYDLRQAFAEGRFFHWGHLELSDRWESVIGCPDGKSLMALRQFGKGWVVLITHPEYRQRTEILEQLVKNVRINTLSRQIGLQWTKWECDPNQKEVLSEWRNISADPVRLQGELVLESPTGTSRHPFAETIPPQKEFQLKVPTDFPAGASGRVQLHLTVPVALNVEVEVRKDFPLQVILPQHRIFRHQMDRFVVDTTITPPAEQTDQWSIAVDTVPASPVKIVAQNENSVVLDWSACKPGEYAVTFHLCNSKGMTIYVTPPETVILDALLPHARVDEQQKIVLGDKRIFPLGFYHVSWNLSDEDRLECLDFLANNGYNVLHASWRPDEKLDVLVAAAKKRGILLFLEGATPERLAQWKDEPVILGWNLDDEPDLTFEDPEKLRSQYESWRAIAPNQLIATVLVSPKSFSVYRRTADWVGHDYYPVLNGLHDISGVYGNHVRLRRDIGIGRAPLAILQCFGYDSGFSLPTVEELRNIIYQTLLADTSGIIFYVYNDGTFNLKDHPEHYALMQRIPSEIAAIEEFLLDASPVMLDTGCDTVKAGRWTLGTRHLEIACNVLHEPVSCNYGDFGPLEVKIHQWDEAGE